MLCLLSTDCIYDHTIGAMPWWVIPLVLGITGAIAVTWLRVLGVPLSVALGGVLAVGGVLLATFAKGRGKSEGRLQERKTNETAAQKRSEARRDNDAEIDRLPPADLDPRFKRWVRPDDENS